MTYLSSRASGSGPLRAATPLLRNLPSEAQPRGFAHVLVKQEYGHYERLADGSLDGTRPLGDIQVLKSISLKRKQINWSLALLTM